MQNVRHESLESHVLNTGNVLGPLEVVRCAISSAFTGVVDHCPSISTPDLHAGCCSSGRDGRGIRPYNTADMVRSTSLTGDQQTYLGHFSQGSAFLSKVDDNTTATVLCLLDGFLDTEDQVRSACADIRSEYVATVALLAG